MLSPLGKVIVESPVVVNNQGFMRYVDDGRGFPRALVEDEDVGRLSRGQSSPLFLVVNRVALLKDVAFDELRLQAK